MKRHPVLILDGDPRSLATLEGMLSGGPYTLHAARECAEASDILKKLRGRAVVLAGKPAGCGSAAPFMTEMLDSFPFLPFTILASAADPSPEPVIEVFRAGAADVLPAPVSKEALYRSLDRSMVRLNQSLEREMRETKLGKQLSRLQEDLRRERGRSSFKGFMMSMTAHDFRTVLTVLDGYMQFIREKCRECHVAGPEGMLRRGMRTVERLQRMANTLLDFESAQAGTMRVESRPVPLGEMLRESMAFYKPYADQKRIDLSLDWDGPEIMGMGDRLLTMEILDNLLYNALKFTPAGGAVRISGRKGAETATIVVSDTGPGIPKEKLEKIFRPGGMAAPRDAASRVGLGLVISKWLVEAQNGKLEVNSNSGKGTQVSFSIPAR